MGLRSRLARWLQRDATPAAPSATVAQDPSPSYVALLARVEKLELERPAFVAQLEAMFDACEDILDRAESKRARATALASKRKKQDEQVELSEDQVEMPQSREQMKAHVRQLMRAQGKLQ